jgi:UDP-2,3-diacylglucosamine hydrolase
LDSSKKIYFASDFHLGTPDYKSSREREQVIVNWLDSIKKDASDIYLVGDLFDFWFEYKHVVPKGYIRFLGKLAELKDAGINVHIFIGNHDMWMFNYLETELDIHIIRQPIQIELQGKSVFIGHGDGLGPGDHGYKFLKKVFSNKICIWLFARLHPNLGIGLANFWSNRSRISQAVTNEQYLGDEEEWLFQYCKRKLENQHYDYFIFGHRHLPINVAISTKSKYINLGEWMHSKTYAVLQNGEIELKKFSS